MFAQIALAAIMITSSAITDLGIYDITYYCSACNTPAYTIETSTGRYEPGYSIASSDIPTGSIVYIDGQEYRVDDTGCSHGVIDVLVDGSNGCHCDEYGRHKSTVYLKR